MPVKVKIEKWKDEIIRQEMWSTPVDELAKKIDVSVNYIYNRRRFSANAAHKAQEVPKKMERPPAVYSNTRSYD